MIVWRWITSIWKCITEKRLERLSNFGTFLSGIGQIGLAFAAIIALLNADTILEKISELKKISEGLQIQNQLISSQILESKKISEKLQHQNQLISSQIIDLSFIIKDITSKEAVKRFSNSIEQIKEDDLKKFIPLDGSEILRGQVYLPQDAIGKTLDFLNSNRTAAEKQMFVMKQLKTKD